MLRRQRHPAVEFHFSGAGTAKSYSPVLKARAAGRVRRASLKPIFSNEKRRLARASQSHPQICDFVELVPAQKAAVFLLVQRVIPGLERRPFVSALPIDYF
jgi:hypothetical protein